MTKISIIDYGLGNLFSVSRAFEHVGAEISVITKPEEIRSAGHLLLPGVGAFAKGMDELTKRDFIESIKQHATSGKPLLGICLGMQMLFESSDEKGEYQGLGIIKGKVARIPDTLKVPHIGWTKLFKNGQPRILGGIGEQDSFYFVHSYHGICENPADLAAYAVYGGNKITASIEKENIFGCQFHPEKSAESGLNICRSFLKL